MALASWPVMVVGDECVDRYWVVERTTQCPEDPHLQTYKIGETFNGKFDQPGMAANVNKQLKALGLATSFWPRIHIPIKNRLVTLEGKLLVRWDEQDHCDELAWLQFEDYNEVKHLALSDYGKGTITDKVVRRLASTYPFAHFYIDTKANPLKFASLLGRATFFPNAREFKQWAPEYQSLPDVVLKMGPAGIQWRKHGLVWAEAPAYPVQVVSSCGAGDTVLAMFVHQAIKGQQDPHLWLAACNMAAAVACQHPFTYTPSFDEVRRFSEDLPK